MASERRKLLIATTVPATIRAFLLPYADHFRRRGWQVDAMSREISEHFDLAPHFDALIDVPWSRQPFSPGNLSCSSTIARAAAENGYDIVHVHTPVAAYVARRALRRLRAQGAGTTGRPKVVYTAHGFHFFKGAPRRSSALYRALERRAARWTDRLIVMNREDRDAARAFMPEGRLVFMPGIGLDFSHYSRESMTREDILAARTEMGLKDDDVLYTMTAEFIPRKRHRDVIEALARARDTRIHVAFVGDGPLRGKMQEMARTYSVHQRTHFLGFLKDPRVLMAASRATILPSGQEGLARALMESACLGVPMIGSDARGVRDVIEPRRGVLYPVGDVLALRDAMQMYAEGPARSVRPDPAWRIENLIEMHELLYEELIVEAEEERERFARAEEERAERARLEAERREAAAREKEAERARRAEQKEIERRANEAIRAERAQRKREEREARAREKHERRMAAARAETEQSTDDDLFARRAELDREQASFERYEWKPISDEQKERMKNG